MDETHIEAAPRVLSEPARRRDALRSISAAGIAVLATLGLAQGSEAKKKRKGKRKNKKRCKGFLPDYGKSCSSDAKCCTGLCCPQPGGGVCLDPKTDVCCPLEHGAHCFSTHPICCLTVNAGGCCESGTHCCDSDPSGCCPD